MRGMKVRGGSHSQYLGFVAQPQDAKEMRVRFEKSCIETEAKVFLGNQLAIKLDLALKRISKAQQLCPGGVQASLEHIWPLSS